MLKVSFKTLLAKCWRDPVWRGVLFQNGLILVIVLIGYQIIQNTLHNLETRGISTGFDFLSQSAGFGIIQTLIEYDESFSFGRTFVVGFLNTLLVSSFGVVLATFLGFLVGIASLSSNWLLARLAGAYVECFRNIPLLLQIFFWYFAVLGVLPSPRESLVWGDSLFLNVRGIYLPKPELSGDTSIFFGAFVFVLLVLVALIWVGRRYKRQSGRTLPAMKTLSVVSLITIPLIAGWLSGVQLNWDLPVQGRFNLSGGLTLIPELVALLLALSIYTAAFIAEVVRAGIQSVSSGQREAAAALGLRQGRILKLVVIPQAMRVIIPPMTNQYLNLIKNSSLATAIGYPDLVNVFAGTTLNQTGQAVEVIAMTMAVYLLISLTVSLFMNLYNRYTAMVER
ncbi:amino acid ABC transporter permease [Endozoicomonas montiporae]|uniref:Amino acid ABC transporter permease n=2 Tax=Endozoicomonas montiporae TaxID=1027273 RepID=A0A081N2S6_9GAMM|nr:amino acid ABC transporter permease [Endozoicomonas montiporae]AMO58016.1 general L-amino acid transport system permease protein [Endozoicomonas montiporae CL-33]KEQ12749.1 amino acid ABC transporter permease [Endozoicomonas montiporae]